MSIYRCNVGDEVITTKKAVEGRWRWQPRQRQQTESERVFLEGDTFTSKAVFIVVKAHPSVEW